MDSTGPLRSNATPRGTLPLKLTELWLFLKICRGDGMLGWTGQSKPHLSDSNEAAV